MNHLPKKFSQVAQIFTKQSKRNVKFSNAGEAVFIKCFTVTDISQSTEYFLVISAKPELKLGQAPWRWTHTEVLYGGVIPVSAAFVSTRDSGCLTRVSSR